MQLELFFVYYGIKRREMFSVYFEGTSTPRGLDLVRIVYVTHCSVVRRLGFSTLATL